METVINLAGLVLIVTLAIAAAVLLWRSDGKGCDKGGPDCNSCPFPCEHNRTGEKNK